MPTLYSGTSNIELIEKNKKAFPPEFQSKSRLSYYSSLFNSVEINSTFYKLPLPATLERWVTEVPEHFRFTLKMWREITHTPDLCFTSGQVEKFMRIADGIGHKKGALLIQLPAGTQSTHAGQLEKLLEQVKRLDPAGEWRLAVEFRHRSWQDQNVYSLLDRYKAALVRHDRPPLMEQDQAREQYGGHESTSFVYLRFHGPKGDYKGSYRRVFLGEQAGLIKTSLARGKDVYAYFNNTMEGDAPKDLAILNALVQDHNTNPFVI